MAPLLADPRISDFSVLAIQEPWRNPCIPTTHNPSSSAFHLFYPPSNDASVCFFVNKSLNPSSYTASFSTPKYGNLRLLSPAQGVRDIMIHNEYRTGNLSPTSSELQPTDELLLLDTHEIFSFVHVSLSDDSVDHVLLGDFNTHHSNWG
jgi:putative hemolysin